MVTSSDILKEIVQLNILKSIDEKIRGQLEEFIKLTINGDTIRSYLAIDAMLKPKVYGILLYILTNARLIKIEITKDVDISSSSFFLNTLISIDRKLIGEDISSIDIIFQNTSVGLRYPVSNKKIADFFQTVEKAKTGDAPKS